MNDDTLVIKAFSSHSRIDGHLNALSESFTAAVEKDGLSFSLMELSGVCALLAEDAEHLSEGTKKIDILTKCSEELRKQAERAYNND